MSRVLLLCAVAASVAVALSAACSSTEFTSAVDDAGGDDAPVAIADSGALDAGPVYQGAITIEATPTYATESPGTLSLRFAPPDGTIDGGVCTSQVIGPCRYYFDCQLPPAPPGVGAGAITVLGGALPGQERFTKYVNGQISQNFLSVPFREGETLDIKAAGDVVRAFDIRSQPGPPLIELTSPAPAAIDSTGQPRYVFPAAGDVTVTWNASDAGPPSTARILLGAYNVYPDGGIEETYLSCDYDSSAGTGVIPAAALTPLRPGSGNLVQIYGLSRSTQTTDNATIDLTLENASSFLGTFTFK